MTPLAWTGPDLAEIVVGEEHSIPPIRPGQAVRLLPDLDVWDYWPVQLPDGQPACIDGGYLLMMLAAPRQADPEDRHALARIRLVYQHDDRRIDLGNLLPDGLSSGSREWSGSAVLRDGGRRVCLFYTAAGEAGEAAPTFRQRLYQTDAALQIIDGRPHLSGWSTPREIVKPDDRWYRSDLSGGGRVGTIKAFRDPAWFGDADGQEYVTFAASLHGSRSAWDGAIGIAARRGDVWHLLPPLLTAEDVCNELERPHLVYRDGYHYCFWSTQRKVFSPDTPRGPNGLYGAWAKSVEGPWALLNGSGLVAANPDETPVQSYSWLVLPDGRVWSFADMVGAPREPSSSEERARFFAGAPAPEFSLTFDRDRVRVDGRSKPR